MENNGLRFYQIFRFGGAIGVNSLSLGELIFANITGFVVFLILASIIGVLLPFILLGLYGLFLLLPNGDVNKMDKLRCNILGILSYIYFLIDYHYGFLGTTIISHYMGSDFLNNMCYLQTSLFIINVLLIFYGDKVFYQIPYAFLRFLAFGFGLYLLTNILTPISAAVMPNLVTQHKPVVNKVETEIEAKKEEDFKFNGDYFNETCNNNKREVINTKHIEPGD